MSEWGEEGDQHPHVHRTQRKRSRKVKRFASIITLDTTSPLGKMHIRVCVLVIAIYHVPQYSFYYKSEDMVAGNFKALF